MPRYGIDDATRDILARGQSGNQSSVYSTAGDVIATAGSQAAQYGANAYMNPVPRPPSDATPFDLGAGALRSGWDEATLGFAPLISGVGSFALNAAQNGLAQIGIAPVPTQSLGQAFQAGAQQYRNDLEQFHRLHPDWDTAGRIAGAVGSAFIPGAPEFKAASLTGKVFAHAGTEGIKSAIAGWNGASGDIGQHVMGALQQGAIGAGTGGVGVPVGMGVQAAARPVMRTGVQAFSTAFPPPPLSLQQQQRLRAAAAQQIGRR